MAIFRSNTSIKSELSVVYDHLDFIITSCLGARITPRKILESQRALMIPVYFLISDKACSHTRVTFGVPGVSNSEEIKRNFYEIIHNVISNVDGDQM